jgi:tol-pal system protein YbgF
MTALLSVLLLSGCCTKRDIEEIKDRISRLERNQQESRRLMERTDSLITEGAEADIKLRNELRYSVDELNEQISMLLQNHNDLMQRVQELLQRPVRVLHDSPGVQSDIASPVTPRDTTVAQTPAIDCDSTYDDSFILMRRSEYDKAIPGFEQFVINCPNHENVSNAHYWMGQCLYSLQKFEDAVAQFEIILNDYKDSPKVSQALYKAARCREEQGRNDEAKRLFQQVIDEHPGTLEAEQAKARLADLN